MSGIYQKKVNLSTVTNPKSDQTLISIDQTGKIFTKDSSGNVTVYPTSSGGGSFTGGTVTGESIFLNGLSATTLSSTTLNVDFIDTLSLFTDNITVPFEEYISDFGGWVPFELTGNAIGTKHISDEHTQYQFNGSGSTGIIGLGTSIPTEFLGNAINVTSGDLSGSSGINAFLVNDFSDFGGGKSFQKLNSSVYVDPSTGEKTFYEISQNLDPDSSDMYLGKTNNEGEIIELVFGGGSQPIEIISELTDPEAEILRIIDDADGEFADRLLVRRDFIYLNYSNGDSALNISDGFGVNINALSGSTGSTFNVNYDSYNSIFNVNQTYGVTVNTLSGSTESTFTVNDDSGGPIFNVNQTYGVNISQTTTAFTKSLLTVGDVDGNILLSVNPHVSGPFNSQVAIFHDGKSDAVFRILDSEFDNYMYVSDSGSTSFNSALSGTGDSIFSVGNDSRTAFAINDINTTFINDPNLFLSNSIPTSSVGLSAGQVFTQTSSELGGTGSTKVLCIA